MKGVFSIIVVLKLSSELNLFIKAVYVIRLGSIPEAHGKLLYLGGLGDVIIEELH